MKHSGRLPQDSGEIMKLFRDIFHRPWFEKTALNYRASLDLMPASSPSLLSPPLVGGVKIRPEDLGKWKLFSSLTSVCVE